MSKDCIATFVRVFSVKEPNEAHQRETLEKLIIDKLFIEKGICETKSSVFFGDGTNKLSGSFRIKSTSQWKAVLGRRRLRSCSVDLYLLLFMGECMI